MGRTWLAVPREWLASFGGAQGVGRAVNQAVVVSTLGVFAFNYVFTQTLLATHPEIVNIK